MFSLFALSLAVATAAPAHAATRTVDHAAGPVTADYRGHVHVRHKEVGMAGPGGRPSTLRCAWTASLWVDRQAQHGSGLMASRSFSTEPVASGSRAGSCQTGKRAIAREVAALAERHEQHLAAAMEADRPVLLAEIDRMTALTN